MGQSNSTGTSTGVAGAATPPRAEVVNFPQGYQAPKAELVRLPGDIPLTPQQEGWKDAWARIGGGLAGAGKAFGDRKFTNNPIDSPEQEAKPTAFQYTPYSLRR